MDTQEQDKDRQQQGKPDGNALQADAEIRRLNEELQRKDDVYLRALADFENYRRRVQREQAGAARSGKRDIILALLETLDGFDRALKHMDEDPEAVTEGLHAVHRQLIGRLQAEGVTDFTSLGERFDPRLHEAVASVEGDEHEPGTIVDELQRGYRWNDEILRPARVRVVR